MPIGKCQPFNYWLHKRKRFLEAEKILEFLMLFAMYYLNKLCVLDMVNVNATMLNLVYCTSIVYTVCTMSC